MIKKFFLNALSSFVGAWIALGLFGVVVFMLIVGVAARMGIQDGGAGIKSNSIFRLKLSGVIEEAEKSRELDPQQLLLNGGTIDRPMTLNTLVQTLAEAKVNKNIKLLYLDCEGVQASPATLNSLREAIMDFKKSGKPVYAYADYMSQADYFVASLADSLYINPDGSLMLQGIGGTTPYMKDLFDKLGVSFTVCKVGTFKSAVEPYVSNTMSGPARAQLDTLYGNLWRYIKKEIATGRKIKTPAIDSLMNAGMTFIMPLENMVKAKLVDRLVYRHEMERILGRASGEDPKKLRIVNPEDLIGETNWGQAYGSKRQVAVLYATGEIKEGGEGIDCEKLVPVILDLADDDHVKALVLRVNSPGGSVFGSEQIAEALKYFKSTGKPFIVSMGDYAASGGYWISADAERIFADPLTITGSIGIFGLFPNISGLLAKIGVSPQTVQTNPRSAMPGLMEPITEDQKAQLQKYIETGYDRFISRVAKGRNMKEEKVRQIAEGRVWDGETAKKIGLVDELGSLNKAVAYAAIKAGLKEDNYDVAAYPAYEPGFWDMLPLGAELGLEKVFAKYLGEQGEEAAVLKKGLKILDRKPVQARAPELKIEL